MSYSTKLVNPTHLRVEWVWHRGQILDIPPFGTLDVTAQIMEQMMPDQPGYEGIRIEMDHFGVFLRDPSQTYESQAIRSVEASIKSKLQQYNAVEAGVRDRAAQAGNVTEDAINHKLEAGGYLKFKKDIEQLKLILKKLKEKDQTSRKKHEQYDPERTLLFTDPPMVFESATAMEMFLSFNPEMDKRQKAYLGELKKIKTDLPATKE